MTAAKGLMRAEPTPGTTRPSPMDPIGEATRLWREHGWADAADGMAAVTSLMRAQAIMQGLVDDVLRPMQLSFARYELLMLLTFTRHGALSMAKAGARLQVHPASVTNAASRLQAAGYVVRRPSPADGRAVLVEITDPGRAGGRRGHRTAQSRGVQPAGDDLAPDGGPGRHPPRRPPRGRRLRAVTDRPPDGLTDDLGHRVGLGRSPERIVSLVPSLTEALAVTVPDRLVGATDWCTHPADLDLPRVRGTKNPDRSAIAGLAPDLVIANKEENRRLDVDPACGRHPGLGDRHRVPGPAAAVEASIVRRGPGRR
jgi:DNA-binding MarR family transcriptional regulator